MAVCLALLPGYPASARPTSTGDADASSLNIQLMDAPINRRDDPRALIYIVDHLSPGTVITRHAKVTNKSGTSQRIAVYAAGAAVDQDAFQFAPGHTANELSSWITVKPSALDLRPHGSVVVTATIRVDRLASTGERYAVIWAANTATPTATANVAVIHRVGVRVYLDVGPGGEPRSDFVIQSWTTARTRTGQPLLTLTVMNTGGRAIDMSGQVSLSGGPAGMRAGPFPVAKGVTLAPGQAGPIQVPLPQDLPNGPWHVAADLESGMVRHTAEATITFPVAGRSETAAFHGPSAMIWKVVVIVASAVLLGIAVSFLFLRRRTRRRYA